MIIVSDMVDNRRFTKKCVFRQRLVSSPTCAWYFITDILVFSGRIGHHSPHQIYNSHYSAGWLSGATYQSYLQPFQKECNPRRCLWVYCDKCVSGYPAAIRKYIVVYHDRAFHDIYSEQSEMIYIYMCVCVCLFPYRYKEDSSKSVIFKVAWRLEENIQSIVVFFNCGMANDIGSLNTCSCNFYCIWFRPYKIVI